MLGTSVLRLESIGAGHGWVAQGSTTKTTHFLLLESLPLCILSKQLGGGISVECQKTPIWRLEFQMEHSWDAPVLLCDVIFAAELGLLFCRTRWSRLPGLVEARDAFPCAFPLLGCVDGQDGSPAAHRGWSWTVDPIDATPGQARAEFTFIWIFSVLYKALFHWQVARFVTL